jgi:ATP-binding cassette, subfamily F, member 3
MISVSGISMHFSGNDLFKNISFVINEKDRIGLVGKNGVGKSTLLNIIAGKLEPSGGSISLPDGQTIGYLPQEIKINSDKSIYEETLSVFEEIRQLEKDLANITKELETRTDYESDEYADLIQSLTEKHERYDLMGADKAEGKVEKILKGLGFKEEDLGRSVAEFSGGWQMRVELAKLLLKMPTLLLLDEPTNHLDIESILWLEEFFKNYPGALIMISHDKMFLDNVTNRTIEIVFGKIHDYKAPYSKFLILREERLSTQKAAFKNQQKFIEQQERFISRFKAKASKAKQAQSKQKLLDKVERIEFDEIDTQSIQFDFPVPPRSGELVLEANQLSKSYDTKEILKNLDFKILRGERVAFVGKNGEGKSTLIKIITNQEKCDGELKLGHNVEIGYYAQIQEKTLDENITVLQTIENIATDDWAKEHKMRGLLGAFLFGPEDVDKKVKVLSGGEKSRLALAKLLLKPVNLLILDEPTNHLDIDSKNVLKTALLNYTGTLILVSHDRDFLQGLTNRTFEFSNKKIKEHLGEISEFLDAHQIETFRQFESSGNKKEKEIVVKETENKNNQQNKKDQEKAIKQLKNKILRIEENIEGLEKNMAQFEAQLKNPDSYQKLLNDKTAYEKYEQIKTSLDNEVALWERTSAELELLQNPA